MSRDREWIAENLSLGGLVGNAVSVVGTVAGWGIRGVGYAGELVAKDAGRGVEIRESCSRASTTVDNGITKGGQLLGRSINKGVDIVGTNTGKASVGVARVFGVDDSHAAKIERVGDMVGRVAVGAVAGMGVSHLATVAAAASGTSGAAATVSGLAALGGGPIATGGGGMVAGQTVVQSIVAVGAASGAVTTGIHESDQGNKASS